MEHCFCYFWWIKLFLILNLFNVFFPKKLEDTVSSKILSFLRNIGLIFAQNLNPPDIKKILYEVSVENIE